MSQKTWHFLRRRKVFSSVDLAFSYINDLYEGNILRLQKIRQKVLGGQQIVSSNWPCYPYIGITVEKAHLNHTDVKNSYGIINEAGHYGTTLTQPMIFESYLKNQLISLKNNHGINFIVGESQNPIPMSFVCDDYQKEKQKMSAEDFARFFVMPELKDIDDRIVNKWGRYSIDDIRPLSLFRAERIDYSLQRIQHYCAANVDHFQNFIILTNYQRYVEDFIIQARELVGKNMYEKLIGPNDVDLSKLEKKIPDHLPQMPAYHLTRPDKNGVTLINIGVGPSNARNITDHLAVLRPHCWLMLGHCAGLRSSQKLGDYVLGHAYARDDHVLDHELPVWVPIPAIAEVQIAFQEAIYAHTSQTNYHQKVRTGTVFTTDNRNWELDAEKMYPNFMLSRAIAVDMESATIAANGYRFRVPYGTLLCISDKPIHGVLKMRSMANSFYETQVSQHLKIGLDTIARIQEKGEQLHSRKLRGFDECPFR